MSGSDGRLEELRARIREVDRELVRLVGARRQLWHITAAARDALEGRSRRGPPLPTKE